MRSASGVQERPLVDRAPPLDRRGTEERTVTFTEASIRRIWQKLDRFNTGNIQVKDIAQNAAFIKQECPKLLDQYEAVAKNGVVKMQDFRRLLLGGRNSGPGGLARASRSSPEAPKVSEDDVRALFDILKDESNFITAKALVEHKDMVMAKFPALIQEFEKIDIDSNSKISWDEIKVYIGGTAEWLELELEGVVGLEELKDQVRSFYRSLVLDQTRRQIGHDIKGLAKTPHMIFQGNPGTGKTSLGRIMAKLLNRIGLTSSADLKEVQRPDLVGEHVGQTGPKTQVAINMAKDGVLFIDEAYRLTAVESKNDFGREAVETLMAAMNEPPGKAPVMIFAGYIKDMANFMRANEGLYRRIGYTFNFTDYSCRDLAQILELITSSKGFQLDPSLLADDRASLAKLIEECTLPRARSLMNGGLCERIFDTAKQNLDARDNPEMPSIVLSREDIRCACLAIPPPPVPVDEHDVRGPGALSAAGVAGAVPAMRAPAQEMMTAPMAGFSAAAAAGVQGRNVWFNVDMVQGLRRGAFGCSGGRAFVSVRLDQAEVHRTACRSSADRSPVWQETRIVPYSGQSLLEFVVMDRGTFAGSAVLALNDLTVLDAALELRNMDKPAGQLFVKAGWQILAGITGEALLRDCSFQPARA